MGLTFDDDQAAAVLGALGLDAGTADVELVTATIRDAATASIAEGAAPSAVAAAARRHGLEAIDTDTLAALRRDATEGRQVKAAAARKAVEDAVEDAIAKGKITLARRKHWVELITADPGMGEVLASVPNETAVPLTAIGHGIDSEGPAGSAAAGEWFN
jgi:hypothetical protein